MESTIVPNIAILTALVCGVMSATDTASVGIIGIIHLKILNVSNVAPAVMTCVET